MINKLFISIFIFTSAFLYSSNAQAEDKKFSEKQFISSVIENNIELKTNRKKLEISKAQLIQAAKTNNLSGIFETQSFNPFQIQNNDNTQFNIGVGYEFVLGNKKELKIQSANYDIENTKLEIGNKSREKILSALQSYNQLLYLYKILELKNIHLIHTSEIYDVVDKQYKAGEVSKYDVYRAELEKNKADKTLSATLKEIKAENMNINYLINQSTEINIIPIEKFQLYDYKNLKPESLISKAINNNFELKQIEIQIKNEEINLKLAKADIFPALESDLLIGNQGINARIQFPVPLFYKQEGEIAFSNATIDYLENEYQSKKQQIISDISNAYQQLILSVDSVNSYEKNILSQSRNLQILAIKRLKAGEGGILEVLEAEHTRQDNEDEYTKLVYEARKNYNYLSYLVGGNYLEENI